MVGFCHVDLGTMRPVAQQDGRYGVVLRQPDSIILSYIIGPSSSHRSMPRKMDRGRPWSTGCVLPVELWFLERELPTPELQGALEAMGATTRRLPEAVAELSGFAMKSATLLLSGFEEVGSRWRTQAEVPKPCLSALPSLSLNIFQTNFQARSNRLYPANLHSPLCCNPLDEQPLAQIA